MDFTRVLLPPDCEVCLICNSALWTDGQVIQCDEGHSHPAERWSTNARSFVIKVWNDIKDHADPE
jgi:hypothetical protein